MKIYHTGCLSKALEHEAELREALQALVDKLTLILPTIDSMCVMEYIHGRTYQGPTIEEEMERARAALGQSGGDANDTGTKIPGTK